MRENNMDAEIVFVYDLVDCGDDNRDWAYWDDMVDRDAASIEEAGFMRGWTQQVTDTEHT